MFPKHLYLYLYFIDLFNYHIVLTTYIIGYICSIYPKYALPLYNQQWWQCFSSESNSTMNQIVVKGHRGISPPALPRWSTFWWRQEHCSITWFWDSSHWWEIPFCWMWVNSCHNWSLCHVMFTTNIFFPVFSYASFEIFAFHT